MAPFFGTLFAVLLLGEALAMRRVFGMALGFTGVAMLVNLMPLELNCITLLAIGACVLATINTASSACVSKNT